mgnify:CR=1 FL=1
MGPRQVGGRGGHGGIGIGREEGAEVGTRRKDWFCWRQRGGRGEGDDDEGVTVRRRELRQPGPGGWCGGVGDREEEEAKEEEKGVAATRRTRRRRATMTMTTLKQLGG